MKTVTIEESLWQEIKDRVEQMRLACTGERELCGVQNDTEALAKLALECEGTLKLFYADGIYRVPVPGDGWNSAYATQSTAPPLAQSGTGVEAGPIPMLLFCPKCLAQHVDAPEPDNGWTNPPHKSHLCHACGTVWRPADVATVGVLDIATCGENDNWQRAGWPGPLPTAPPPLASGLHPSTADLVRRFAQIMAEKFHAAEVKHGYTDAWLGDGWEDECRTALYEHLAKGDPRDVANYCAFMWHHGWSTAIPPPSAEPRAGDEVERAELNGLDILYQSFAAAERQATWGGSFEKEDGARRQCAELGKKLWTAALAMLNKRAARQSGAKL